MGFKSDIEIAQEAKIQDIREIAKKLCLGEDDIELYGKYKAKISDACIARIKDSYKPNSSRRRKNYYYYRSCRWII